MKSKDEMRLELERLISKSSVWPEECVGKMLCWFREKAPRRLRKEKKKDNLVCQRGY